MPKPTNKQKILAALLETSSIREAALASGLSEPTIYRYLKDADFQREYRNMRRSLVEASISQIQTATSEAVETLTRNLHCENPSAENRAAQLIIETALKGVELIDVIERLEVLEDAIKAKG